MEKEYGRTWIWTAIDSTTRLIITFLIGDRTLEDAHSFLKDLISRMNEKPLFVSDELPHYENGLEEMFHTLIQPEPTGQRGRPKNPEKIVHEDLDYATVHKTRKNGCIVNVETKVVFGSESRIANRLESTPSNTVNTSFVERSNLNWRLWDAHLRRQSTTFAKSIRWLKAKFSLVVACYNFIRPHETLSRQSDRSFTPKTPAMAAELTDHPWSLAELLWFPSICQ